MTASTAVSAAGRPSVIEVFREASYGRLWASGLCMSIARWMDLVALGWLALQLTGSPFMVGLAAFARAAPMMAIGPFAGIVADRVPRGQILLVTQATGVVTALALAAIFAGGLRWLLAAGRLRGRLRSDLGAGLSGAADRALRLAGRAARGPGGLAGDRVDAAAKMLGPLAAGVLPGAPGPGRLLRRDGGRLRERAGGVEHLRPPARRPRRRSRRPPSRPACGAGCRRPGAARPCARCCW